MRPLRLAGHFGEWMQGRLGPEGPVVLVTLPCAVVGVELFHRPAPGGLRLHGVGLPPERVRRFLDLLGLRLTGAVRMRALAAPGLGTGVSTARLVGLARLAGWQGDADMLARACVAAEGASDPLMFDAPERVLWASRSGRAVSGMPALPRYEIVGGTLGGPRWTDPADEAFPDVADLVAAWQRTESLAGFAALASESAARSLALRGPQDDPTWALARELGALGWTMAHTGAVRGLVFTPGTVPEGAEAALRAAGLRGVLRFRGGGR